MWVCFYSLGVSLDASLSDSLGAGAGTATFTMTGLGRGTIPSDSSVLPDTIIALNTKTSNIGVLMADNTMSPQPCLVTILYAEYDFQQINTNKIHLIANMIYCTISCAPII